MINLNQPVKVGIIGLGRHCVQSHITHLARLADVKVEAVYDPSAESVSRIKDLVSDEIQIYNSEDELLASDIDAVLIMNPDEFHAESFSKSIANNKNVFVEKPLAINSEQLKVIEAAMERAQQKGLLVSSCHPRRFDPPYLWIKNNLEQLISKLGQIEEVSLDFSYHKPTKHWKHNRGLLIDHLNHEIDLVNWYLGHNSFEAWKIEDAYDKYQVLGKRADGISFNFKGTRRLDNYKYPEFVSIRFTHGDLNLETTSGKLVIRDHESDQRTEQNIQGADYQKRFEDLNKNFLKALLNKVGSYLSSKDILVNTQCSVKLTENSYYSHTN